MADISNLQVTGEFLSKSNPLRATFNGGEEDLNLLLMITIRPKDHWDRGDSEWLVGYDIKSYHNSQDATPPTRDEISHIVTTFEEEAPYYNATENLKIKVELYSPKTKTTLTKIVEMPFINVNLETITPSVREEDAYLTTTAIPTEVNTGTTTLLFLYGYTNIPTNPSVGDNFTQSDWVGGRFTYTFNPTWFMFNHTLPKVPITIDCLIMVNNVQVGRTRQKIVDVWTPKYTITTNFIPTPNNTLIPSDDHRDVFKNTYVYSYSGVEVQGFGNTLENTYTAYDRYQTPKYTFRVYAVDMSGATPNKLLYEYVRTDSESREFNYSIPLSQLTGLSYYINGCTLRLRITMTDERGFMDGYTRDLTIEPYSKPQLQLNAIGRCGEDGTYNDEGTYIGIETVETHSSVNKLNLLDTYAYEYKEKGSEYYSSGDDLVSGSKVISGNYFDMNKAYDVKLTLIDYIGNSVVLNCDIATSNAIIDIMMGGNGMALGMMASVEDALEIGYPNTNIRDGALNIKKFIGGGSVNLSIAPKSLNYAHYTTDSKYGHYFSNPMYVNGDITTPNKLVSNEFGIGTQPPAFDDCLDVDLEGKTSGRIDRITLNDASEDYNCPVDSGQFIANRITFGGINQTNSMVTVVLYEIKPNPYRVWINSYYNSDWIGWRVLAESTQYSTDETPTGETWIDGKPIYRKTIKGNRSNLKGQGLTIQTGLNGINEIWIDYSHSFWYIRGDARGNGLIEVNINNTVSTATANSGAQASVWLVPNSGSPTLRLESGGGVAVNRFYVTLLYTKTYDD